MKRAATVVAVLVVLVALSACVAGSAESEHAASSGALGQFCLGLWQGVIAPVTLIVEVINRFMPHLLPWSAHLYETKAAGVFYDIGFYIGLGGGPLAIRSRF